VNGERGAYIFADLRQAQPVNDGGQWQVKVDVADARHPEWRIPAGSEREARQWSRVFMLAVEQKL
jgi:hypothetical protein